MTASAPENAAVRPARSASEETTTTRDLSETPVNEQSHGRQKIDHSHRNSS
jgi:hypothetical protein